jgi:hypothetical protein
LRSILLIVLFATAADAQPDTGGAQRFVGAWRLVSWTQRMADGTTRAGVADTGSIVYTDAGRMCAVLQNSKRQKWSGPPKTVEEAVARTSGSVSYCARVEVHAKEGFVLHHVDVDFNPSSVGIVRKRWFTFDGPNRLALSVDRGELANDVQESVLVWERIK